MRGILFDTMRALGDKHNPMDLARAKAISDVAQTLINSAKVEVEYMKQTGSDGSGFIADNRLPDPARPGISHPQPGRTVHKLK